MSQFTIRKRLTKELKKMNYLDDPNLQTICEEIEFESMSVGQKMRLIQKKIREIANDRN